MRKQIYTAEQKRRWNSAHRKTIDGFLMNTYHNMMARVRGSAKKSTRHLYVGMDILNKDAFINFSRNNRDFLKLYKSWVINKYDSKLSPSVNRIDPAEGYTLDNIEWITHSQNSSLSSVTRRNKNGEFSMIKKIVGIK